MKCKIFTGTPPYVERSVNEWLDAMTEKDFNIVNVTQSHGTANDCLTVTIIYTF